MTTTRGPGQFIGEASLFEGGQGDATWKTSVRARGHVTALLLTRSHLRSLLKQRPEAEAAVRAGRWPHAECNQLDSPLGLKSSFILKDTWLLPLLAEQITGSFALSSIADHCARGGSPLSEHHKTNGPPQSERRALLQRWRSARGSC